MSTIDDVLIERLSSPLTGWLRHRLGICQWRASIESLNGSTVFYIAAVTLEIAAKGPNDGIFVTMLRALFWLLILEVARRRACRQAASSVGTRTARAREWLIRTALVAMVPLSLCYAYSFTNLLYSASLTLLLCHLYLKASDTPPPEPGGRLAFGHSRP